MALPSFWVSVKRGTTTGPLGRSCCVYGFCGGREEGYNFPIYVLCYVCKKVMMLYVFLKCGGFLARYL